MNNSSCDPNTGKCICNRGWTGDDCSEPCPNGTFGLGCKELCPEVVFGNKTCDHVTGHYRCRTGYIGLTCQHPCPRSTFGPDCSLKCQCINNGECNHINGQCQCVPGFTGSTCNVPCPDGYYGSNCSQLCKCKNGASCRKNDGNCVCKPGWMGTHCEESKLCGRLILCVMVNKLFFFFPQFVPKDFSVWIVWHTVNVRRNRCVMWRTDVCVVKGLRAKIAWPRADWPKESYRTRKRIRPVLRGELFWRCWPSLPLSCFCSIVVECTIVKLNWPTLNFMHIRRKRHRIDIILITRCMRSVTISNCWRIYGPWNQRIWNDCDRQQQRPKEKPIQWAVVEVVFFFYIKKWFWMMEFFLNFFYSWLVFSQL